MCYQQMAADSRHLRPNRRRSDNLWRLQLWPTVRGHSAFGRFKFATELLWTDHTFRSLSWKFLMNSSTAKKMMQPKGNYLFWWNSPFCTLLYVRTFDTAADSCCFNILIEIPDFASRMTNPEIIFKWENIWSWLSSSNNIQILLRNTNTSAKLQQCTSLDTDLKALVDVQSWKGLYWTRTISLTSAQSCSLIKHTRMLQVCVLSCWSYLTFSIRCSPRVDQMASWDLHTSTSVQVCHSSPSINVYIRITKYATLQNYAP